MRMLLVVAAAVAAIALPAAALAVGPAKVFFEDTVPSGSSSSVTIVTHRPAAFKVLLRVPTAGRRSSSCSGRSAPKGGPLIHDEQHVAEQGRVQRRGGLLLLQGLVRAAAEGDVHVAHRVGGQAEGARARRADRALVRAGLAEIGRR